MEVHMTDLIWIAAVFGLWLLGFGFVRLLDAL